MIFVAGQMEYATATLFSQLQELGYAFHNVVFSYQLQNNGIESICSCGIVLYSYTVCLYMSLSLSLSLCPSPSMWL